jgi:DNA-binding MarR family transcriptional regulator
VGPALRRRALVSEAERKTSGDQGVDAKLVGALDRAGHALDAELRRGARAQGLTATQARVLVRLSAEPVERRRVGPLAAEFDVRQPTVSDAVSALERKGLVRRRTARDDGRAVDLELTGRGRGLAAALRNWDERVRASLGELTAERKEAALSLLLELLADLNRQGVIAEARMCTTCRFFRRRGDSRAYCRLLEIELAPADLRVDCPEHERRRAAA